LCYVTRTHIIRVLTVCMLGRIAIVHSHAATEAHAL